MVAASRLCVCLGRTCVRVCSCIRRTLAYPGVKSLVLSLCLHQCLQHSCSTPAARGMSPIVRNRNCFNPMLCHCKVACHDNTLSLMFGCKVGIHHQCCFTRRKPFEFLRLCINTFASSSNAAVLPGQEVCQWCDTQHLLLMWIIGLQLIYDLLNCVALHG